MDESKPLLVLIIPAHHDVEPDAGDELWRYVRERYGAELDLVRSTKSRGSVVPLHSGPWRWDGPVPLHDDLWPRIQRTTFSLEWMQGVP